ncbi:6-phosphogluconate dehydrogenase [Ophiocordyceps camponoti-floridani]|uniref:6-phosphogluconate dehydrogenase n=1 Tax=Ophiocordyceps camponoti-floridani TaxID=2030778 RepID=A0A8H4VGA3_9HYPO|nr:6-phosphogluconate dehydrogenase [Ophiocordyceps camponoti-floridani]
MAAFGRCRFTYFATPNKPVDCKQLSSNLPRSKQPHNAAVILSTPDFYNDIRSSFQDALRAICDFDSRGERHVLFAIVDGVTPASRMGASSRAVSVLRGWADDVLPDLSMSTLAGGHERDGDIGALVFEWGGSEVTVPLARTTFVNGRDSTLLAMRFQKGQSSLTNQMEKHSQRIVLSRKPNSKPVSLWTPLTPITPPRIITNSFGNIVKAIDINGSPSPASAELETAVQKLFKTFPSGVPPESWGIWAVVTPESVAGSQEDALLPLESVTRDGVKGASRYVERLYHAGGKLHRILSGGGGWGDKKGLLALDPQQSHTCYNEDTPTTTTTTPFETAPPGSRIQFFAPTDPSLACPPDEEPMVNREDLRFALVEMNSETWTVHSA